MNLIAITKGGQTIDATPAALGAFLRQGWVEVQAVSPRHESTVAVVPKAKTSKPARPKRKTTVAGDK